MSLTINDLRSVYKVTFNAKRDWRKVLLELGLDFAAIESIGSKRHEDPDHCYLDGLSVWLRSGERCWSDLVDALSSPTVGHKDIAEEIKRKFLQMAVQAGAYRQPITGELVIFTNEQLGTGAFGAVFKGSYREMPCAVKLLLHVAMQIQTSLPVVQGPENAVERFDRECEFLKSLQHPNIVQHLSTEKHPLSGNTILVLELMDCNLRDYFSTLPKESLSIDCQLSLSTDVASGLAYIHSKGVIHRDLCGHNILLNGVQDEVLPVAKISDFGISRLLYNRPSQLSSLTALGHRMGYLPSEAARLEDENYDFGLDVFSLGVIMVQIACKLETVKSANERLQYLVQIPDTHILKPFIIKCLQEDTKRRPSAMQVWDELRTSELHSEDQNATDTECGFMIDQAFEEINQPGPLKSATNRRESMTLERGSTNQSDTGKKLIEEFPQKNLNTSANASWSSTILCCLRRSFRSCLKRIRLLRLVMILTKGVGLLIFMVLFKSLIDLYFLKREHFNIDPLNLIIGSHALTVSQNITGSYTDFPVFRFALYTIMIMTLLISIIL